METKRWTFYKFCFILSPVLSKQCPTFYKIVISSKRSEKNNEKIMGMSVSDLMVVGSTWYVYESKMFLEHRIKMTTRHWLHTKFYLIIKHTLNIGIVFTRYIYLFILMNKNNMHKRDLILRKKENYLWTLIP